MYPDFQKISFHEQSDRVSFLEGKVFQYGWIFLPFIFFTENWKVFIPSILMKTVKTLGSSAVTYILEFAKILTTRL